MLEYTVAKDGLKAYLLGNLAIIVAIVASAVVSTSAWVMLVYGTYLILIGG